MINMPKKSPSPFQQPQRDITFNIAQLDLEQDVKRKELVKSIEDILKGRVITYFANFPHPFGIIHNEDIMLFEEILRSVGKTENLFLIINSPGGLPDVAEKMIILCRSRCKNFYVIVPNQAKSAATMIALGADKIFMSHASELGPIDPIIQYGENNFPAQAYLNGFYSIKDEILESKNPLLVQTYLPLLSKIDPTVVDICERSVADSEIFAIKWLKKHMLRHDKKQAEKTAAKLSNAEEYLTHSKVIDYNDAKKRLKLNVQLIDKESDLWKLIWELYVRSQKYIAQGNLTKLLSSNSLEIRQSISVKRWDRDVHI